MLKGKDNIFAKNVPAKGYKVFSINCKYTATVENNENMKVNKTQLSNNFLISN